MLNENSRRDKLFGFKYNILRLHSQLRRSCVKLSSLRPCLDASAETGREKEMFVCLFICLCVSVWACAFCFVFVWLVFFCSFVSVCNFFLYSVHVYMCCLFVIACVLFICRPVIACPQCSTTYTVLPQNAAPKRDRGGVSMKTHYSPRTLHNPQSNVFILNSLTFLLWTREKNPTTF